MIQHCLAAKKPIPFDATTCNLELMSIVV